MLWFTNFTGKSVGRIGAPAISGPAGMAAGPDGALWFTNPGNNSIGRISTKGRVSSHSGAGINGPQGIAAGKDGALWFTNAAGNSIGRISTAGKVTIYRHAGIKEPEGITAYEPAAATWRVIFAMVTGLPAIKRTSRRPDQSVAWGSRVRA
jgi:virginiamycin B lyase